MGHRCASIELVSILILSGILFFETIPLGFCSKADVNTLCMEVERNALLKLKEGLTDPSDQLLSWVAEDSDCCKWKGVGCNNITGHVVSLNLRNPYDSFRYSYGTGWFYDPDVTLHALGGEINPSFLVLKDLVYLDLSMNDFGGLQLPSFIGSLEKLKFLNLSWSSFRGVIPPNLGNLSRLVYLDLKGNYLESDLRWLPSLSSLKYLNLGLANLSMAAPNWLPSVNMLPSLVELHLPSCDLSVLPATLSYINFTSLAILNLPSNGFNSTLPPWLFNLTKLVYLDLSYNYLHGALPETFSSLTSLRTLDLSKNRDIGGKLPKALGMFCNLQTLRLHLVNIHGVITEFIDGLSGCKNSSLVMLDFESNQLTGNLPSSLGNLRNLRYLQLADNSFQGSIPESIGNLTSLEEFHLSSNQMHGAIPENLGQLSALVILDISLNSWEGVITEAHLVNLRNLKEGLYAVLGAASLMVGSMRMTVSQCVIFLELTNNLLLLPITMIVLLISKTVGDCFNPSIYEIILHLKGLPFLDAHPEPWMRNLNVGELADAKPPVVTLHGIEKVERIVELLRNTTHNGFPVVDDGIVPPVGLAVGTTELHGLILGAHLVQVLKKKWFLKERRRTEEWEVREKFTAVELAERELNIEEVAVTGDEMEMYVDLRPLTSTTPYTVLETMSVAKAMVLFRQVGLRHLLILPKYEAAGVPPVAGILTRQDLIAYNILNAFPHLKNPKSREKGN